MKQKEKKQSIKKKETETTKQHFDKKKEMK